MQQTGQQEASSSFNIPEIEAIINLLLTQVTAYVVENFSHSAAKSATQENIHKVLDTLSLDPRALSLVEPGPEGLFNRTSSLLTSTAVTVGRAALSPLTRYIDPNQPFHRLRHLLYFAGKARELKELLARLQRFAGTAPEEVDEGALSAFTNDCQELIEGVGEFFKSASKLVSTGSDTTIVVVYQRGSLKLDGMKGLGGNSTLADKIITNILTEHLDIQKLLRLTSQIESQKQIVLSKITVHNDELKKQQAIDQLEREAKAKEMAAQRTLAEFKEANEAREKALREAVATEIAKERALREVREKALAQKMAEERALREAAEKETAQERSLREAAERETLLTQERERGEREQLKLALEQMHSGVNALDGMGLNTLHRAIKANDPIGVANALQSGANANVKTGNGLSPLCLALIYDDNKCQSLSTTIDENTINIIAQLLRSKAIANEFITALKRNFIHFLLFKSYNLSTIEDPQLRSDPKCELIKLFLLNGCAFDGGNPRCGSDISKFIDNKKLTLKQERAREILVTFKRLSVVELSTLLDWHHETLGRYQTLASRTDSETALKHMIVIKPFFERYSFIFDLFLCPQKRNAAIEKAADLLKTVSAAQMTADIQRLETLGMESQVWLNKQPKQQPKTIDAFFAVDSAALARENQLYLQTIIQNLIKCIEKALRMHEPRWVEGQADRQLCILTPLEIEVLDLNFQQANQLFREHLEKKRNFELKQADAIAQKWVGLGSF